ncbi:uncharacterized protein [Oscarella lobularis]
MSSQLEMCSLDNCKYKDNCGCPMGVPNMPNPRENPMFIMIIAYGKITRSFFSTMEAILNDISATDSCHKHSITYLFQTSDGFDETVVRDALEKRHEVGCYPKPPSANASANEWSGALRECIEKLNKIIKDSESMKDEDEDDKHVKSCRAHDFILNENLFQAYSDLAHEHENLSILADLSYRVRQPMYPFTLSYPTILCNNDTTNGSTPLCPGVLTKPWIISNNAIFFSEKDVCYSLESCMKLESKQEDFVEVFRKNMRYRANAELKFHGYYQARQPFTINIESTFFDNYPEGATKLRNVLRALVNESGKSVYFLNATSLIRWLTWHTGVPTALELRDKEYIKIRVFRCWHYPGPKEKAVSISYCILSYLLFFVSVIIIIITCCRCRCCPGSCLKCHQECQCHQECHCTCKCYGEIELSYHVGKGKTPSFTNWMSPFLQFVVDQISFLSPLGIIVVLSIESKTESQTKSTRTQILKVVVKVSMIFIWLGFSIFASIYPAYHAFDESTHNNLKTSAIGLTISLAVMSLIILVLSLVSLYSLRESIVDLQTFLREQIIDSTEDTVVQLPSKMSTRIWGILFMLADIVYTGMIVWNAWHPRGVGLLDGWLDFDDISFFIAYGMYWRMSGFYFLIFFAWADGWIMVNRFIKAKIDNKTGWSQIHRIEEAKSNQTTGKQTVSVQNSDDDDDEKRPRRGMSEYGALYVRLKSTHKAKGARKDYGDDSQRSVGDDIRATTGTSGNNSDARDTSSVSDGTSKAKDSEKDDKDSSQRSGSGGDAPVTDMMLDSNDTSKAKDAKKDEGDDSQRSVCDGQGPIRATTGTSGNNSRAGASNDNVKDDARDTSSQRHDSDGTSKAKDAKKDDGDDIVELPSITSEQKDDASDTSRKRHSSATTNSTKAKDAEKDGQEILEKFKKNFLKYRSAIDFFIVVESISTLANITFTIFLIPHLTSQWDHLGFNGRFLFSTFFAVAVLHIFVPNVILKAHSSSQDDIKPITQTFPTLVASFYYPAVVFFQFLVSHYSSR